jgi:hypothetical protein
VRGSPYAPKCHGDLVFRCEDDRPDDPPPWTLAHACRFPRRRCLTDRGPGRTLGPHATQRSGSHPHPSSRRTLIPMAPRHNRRGFFLFEVQPSGRRFQAGSSGGRRSPGSRARTGHRGWPDRPAQLFPGGRREAGTNGAVSTRRVSLRRRSRSSVLDPEIGPERPADDLRLGASFPIRPPFERLRLVLVEVAHLPNEAAAGEGLPGTPRFRLSGRHGESIAERGA